MAADGRQVRPSNRIPAGRRSLRFAAVALSLPAILAAAPAPPKAGILGRWTGTSTCTRIPGNQFCHDENVVYDFVDLKDPEKVRLKAARVIDGKPEPMYELDFEYRSEQRRWASEFVRPRAHGLWTYAVEGARLTGTLFLLPGNEVARNVVAKR